MTTEHGAGHVVLGDGTRVAVSYRLHVPPPPSAIRGSVTLADASTYPPLLELRSTGAAATLELEDGRSSEMRVFGVKDLLRPRTFEIGLRDLPESV